MKHEWNVIVAAITNKDKSNWNWNQMLIIYMQATSKLQTGRKQAKSKPIFSSEMYKFIWIYVWNRRIVEEIQDYLSKWVVTTTHLWQRCRFFCGNIGSAFSVHGLRMCLWLWCRSQSHGSKFMWAVPPPKALKALFKQSQR